MFEGSQVESKRNHINYTFKEFVSNFIWFLSAADTTEKLGIVRMLLCNVNATSKLGSETKETLDKMIDEVQALLEKEI